MSRLRSAVADVRFYMRPPCRWDAVLRSLWLKLVRDHKTEMCQECGRAQPFIWHAPDPLWLELIHRPSGILCPFCFEAKAKAAGIWVDWTPVVAARGRKGDWHHTSNWWHDATRDWLLMGVSDPDIQAHYPEQRPWDVVREALATAPEHPQQEKG